MFTVSKYLEENLTEHLDTFPTLAEAKEYAAQVFLHRGQEALVEWTEGNTTCVISFLPLDS